MTQHCRVCNCSNFVACAGGCWWVEDDLCSSCAPAPRAGSEVVWLPFDGTVLGHVTGWDGTVPIIVFDSQLSGPLDSVLPVAGMPSEPFSEAPTDEATPRTRGVEPATYPDPAPRAVVGASLPPSAAPRG